MNRSIATEAGDDQTLLQRCARASAAGFRITRPQSLVLVIIAVATGLLFDGSLTLLRLATLAVVPVLVYGAAFAFNDSVDVAADTINRPERPIPRGALGKTGALVLSAGLFVTAVAFASHRSTIDVAYALTICGLSCWYTLQAKRIPFLKNIVTAILVSSVFLYVAVNVEHAEASHFLFVGSVLFMCSREVIMDVRDMPGDAAAQINTTAVALGTRRATVLAFTIALVGVAWFFAPSAGLAFRGVALPMPLLTAVTVLWFICCAAILRSKHERRFFALASAFKVYFYAVLLLFLLVRTEL